MPWNGREVRRARVLYVAGEGARGIAGRKRAWATDRSVHVDAKWFVVRRSSVNLFRAGLDFEHLLAYVAREQFDLVIFDTLRRMSGGANGNDSDMGVVVDNIDRVRRALNHGGSVIAVAHSDKGDNDARGYSGIEDDADVVFRTKREKNLEQVALNCAKMKDAPDDISFLLGLRRVGSSVVLGSLEDPGGALFRDVQIPSDRAVMAVMTNQFAQTGASVADLTEATGLSQTTVYQARKRLLRDHRLSLHGARLVLPVP